MFWATRRVKVHLGTNKFNSNIVSVAYLTVKDFYENGDKEGSQEVMSPYKKNCKLLNHPNRQDTKKIPCSEKLLMRKGGLATPRPLLRIPWRYEQYCLLNYQCNFKNFLKNCSLIKFYKSDNDLLNSDHFACLKK